MENVKELCRDARDIIIYGAGSISNIMYFYLKENGFEDKIKGFTVSNLNGNPSEKYGINVLGIEDVSKTFSDALYLVAVQKVLHKTISDKLCSLNCFNYICIDDDALISQFYQLLYKEPIQNNKILFINMKGMGYGCNPKYIAEKIINLDVRKQFDLVWAVCKMDYNLPKEIRAVLYGSLDYYRELATAHIWIDNTRKTFDIRKRDGQFYIQTWHGAAPIKKVEKDVIDKLPETYLANAVNDSAMADLFISGSDFYTELYKKSFWYSGEIMQVGLPRQDVFWNTEMIRKKVFNHFHIPKETALVLYAPTFRRDLNNKYYDLNIAEVTKALEARFNKKFICAVSKHPDNRNISYTFKNSEYLAVEQYEDFEELLAAADVLITDYSGCMYDYSFTGRPVFLYQKDYDEYINDRNFYIPMDELPYITSKTNHELVEKIKKFNQEKYTAELGAFMKKMGNHDTGNASEIIAKKIIDEIGDK